MKFLRSKEATAELLLVLPAEIRSLIAAGSIDAALGMLRAELTAAPDDPKINLQLGCGLLLLGRTAEARAPLRRAATDPRYSALAWTHLAEVEAQAGRPARAIVSLRRVVALQPDVVSSRLNYGRLLFRLAKIEHAAAQAKTILRLAPRSPEGHQLFGLTLCCRRRFQEASTAFAAWVRYSPGEPQALLFLARARLLSGDGKGARNACQRSIDSNERLAPAHFLMSRIGIAAGNLRLGQAHLESCVALRPNSSTFRALLAEVMAGRAQYGAAVAMAESALALNANSRTAALVAAKCHYALGEFKKAQEVLRHLGGKLPAWAQLPNGAEPLPGAAALRASNKANINAAATSSDARQKTENVGSSTSAATGRSEPEASSINFSMSDAEDESQSENAIKWLIARYDALINFMALERALLLRNILFETRTKRNFILTDLTRGIVVIVAHVYFFWLIGRAMPAGISSVEFCNPAFTIWFLFKGASELTKVGAGYEKASANANVKWINILIGCFVVKYFVPIFGFIIVVFIFLMLNDTRVMGMLSFPDVPKLTSIWMIASLLGLGFGLFSAFLKTRWTPYSFIYKILMWLLYVTCGVYESYVSMPAQVAPYFIINPLIPLVEYSRQATHAGYPVWGGPTIIYPLILAGLFLVCGLALHRVQRAEVGA
jgi:tetratricopeptide (TPR) repeat protein/ABC-type polysaccharide/polyol phosphate export permease